MTPRSDRLCRCTHPRFAHMPTWGWTTCEVQGCVCPRFEPADGTLLNQARAWLTEWAHRWPR
jgi:hypothetical protein